jgi:antitoxin (DNA-binding transcriptional repressor) of toxin-antitoxin stability system
MCQVNVFKAKTDLSRLIALLESAEEDEVVIARNGQPVARLTAWTSPDARRRIGAAKGLFVVPDDFGAEDGAVAALMADGAL